MDHKSVTYSVLKKDIEDRRVLDIFEKIVTPFETNFENYYFLNLDLLQ